MCATQPVFEPLIIIEGILWPVVREARRWFSALFIGISDDSLVVAKRRRRLPNEDVDLTSA